MKSNLTGEERQEVKARRRGYLVRIAGEDEARFGVEWRREIGFWLQEIHEEVANGSITGWSVFDPVHEARTTLALCGESAVRVYEKKTVDILNNECCRTITPMMGKGVYRMNGYVG